MTSVTSSKLTNCATLTPVQQSSAMQCAGTDWKSEGFRGAAPHAIRLCASATLTGTDAVLWSY